MKDGYLEPLDPELFDRILAERDREYERQGTLLKRTTQALIPMAVLCFSSVAATAYTAHWAITNEQIPYAIKEDAIGKRTTVGLATPPTTDEGRLAAAREFIDNSFLLTQDRYYNLDQRGIAVEKLIASPDEKGMFLKSAEAEVSALEGFIHTIEAVEFERPSNSPNHNGMSWNALITLKVQDHRKGAVERQPMRLDYYRLPIIMEETTPTASNLFGLRFAPTVAEKIPVNEKK